MFFALLFLILAAAATTLFPDWSGLMVLSLALGCVVVLRLALGLCRRTGGKPD